MLKGKRGSAVGEANKTFITVGVSVLVLVVLVAVMFYIAPKESVVGEAFLQDGVCEDRSELLITFEIEGRGEVTLECDDEMEGLVNNQRAKTYCVDSNYESSNKFYCSTQQEWIVCNEETAGQGVENLNNVELYNNNYVCNGQGWVEINNCGACAGALPGQCVGSSIFDIGSRNLLQTHGSAPGSLVGCVQENSGECIIGEESTRIAYDSFVDFQGRGLVCGEENSWLYCGNNIAVSDGEKWICNGEQTFVECTQDNLNERIGHYACQLNANQYQWVSEFEACSDDLRFQLRQGIQEQEICYNQQWLTCDVYNEQPYEGLDLEIVCDENGFQVSELMCNNNVDDDHDNQVDCSDNDCGNNIERTLSSTQLFEITVRETDCASVNIVRLVESRDFVVPETVYQEFNVCDQGTENLRDQVAVCQGNNPEEPAVSSLQFMRNENARPRINQETTIIYEPSEPKEVGVVLVHDLENRFTSPIGTFTRNLLASQRIMLKIGSEHYLLSHEGEGLFATENLQLTHVPLGRMYQAEIYPGTNQYVFNVLGNRLISVGLNDDRSLFEISALSPGERPRAYVVPTDLTQNLELIFKKGEPVDITSPELGTFTICRTDNERDTQQTLICLDDENFASLALGELTVQSVGDNNLALLYQYVDGEKQVSVFTLNELESLDFDDEVATTYQLEYNDFINAMVEGRRAAFEFEEKLYLAEHNESDTFSLNLITLTSYQEEGTTDFVASGSEDYVEFLTLDGKISIRRNYGLPPPPFEVVSLTKQQLVGMPINLDDQLFASFSSEVPILIRQPLDVGVISKHEDDISRLESSFRVQAGIYEPNLILHQPYIILGEDLQSEILYYYHSAEIDGVTPIKTVSVYRNYDLRERRPHRDFDDTFINAITRGAELTLQYDDETFFLLGYEGANEDDVQFFNFNRLTLRDLVNGETYFGTADGNEISFEIPGDRLTIRLQQTGNHNEIYFELTGQQQLDEERDDARRIAFEGFYAEITTENLVRIGTNDLYQCFKRAYADYPSAKVCYDGHQVRVNPTAVVTISDENYFLESNEQLGDNKVVRVRKILSLPYDTSATDYDWFGFVTEVVEEREPLFDVKGDYYIPSAVDSRLQSFQLAEFPEGVQQSVILTDERDISADGNIILHDKIVKITQEETDNEERPVEAFLLAEEETYLPDDGSIVELNLTEQTSLLFRTTLDNYGFGLEVQVINNDLLRLRVHYLDEPNTPILQKLFSGGDSRFLILNGERVELKVTDDLSTVALRKI